MIILFNCHLTEVQHKERAPNSEKKTSQIVQELPMGTYETKYQTGSFEEFLERVPQLAY